MFFEIWKKTKNTYSRTLHFANSRLFCLNTCLIIRLLRLRLHSIAEYTIGLKFVLDFQPC